MKIDKTQEKQLYNYIRLSVKKRKLKVKKQSIYYMVDNDFIICNYLIVNHEKIVYRIHVKPYEYDNIFWEIMQMPENIDEPDSLRACGAFKAPSIEIKTGEIEIEENFEKLAEDFVDFINSSSRNFLESNNLEQYIIVNDKFSDCGILKCLEYIHLGEQEKAVEIANKSIENNEMGRFVNEGKGFFEWVVACYNK